MTQLPSTAAPSGDIDDPQSFRHQFVDLYRLRMHYVDEGAGPTVILLHGFPFLWYTWRHQIRALSAAGFRVVAPDLRGFGQTSQPSWISDYEVCRFVGDIVGLVRHLGIGSAAVVGHGFGATIAYHCVALRPDLFSGVAMLSSTPRVRRPDSAPRWSHDGVDHGQLVFFEDFLSSTGTIDLISKDVAGFLTGMYHSLSGDCPEEERLRWVWPATAQVGPMPWAPRSPRRRAEPSSGGPLGERALRYYIEQYGQCGIRAPATVFRALDTDWSARCFLDGLVVTKPALFVSGGRDPWLRPLCGINPRAAIQAELRAGFTAVQESRIERAGHMLSEESPLEVNDILLRFVSNLPQLSW